MQWFFQAVGYGLCHQLSSRSLFAGAYQLPVCARDTGIYLGFALSAVLIVFLARGSRPTEAPRPFLLVVVLLFFGVMVLDGATEYAGLRATNNDLRLVTGLLAGYALALVAVPMVNSGLWRHTSGSRPLSGVEDAWAWFMSIPVAFVTFRYVLVLTGVVYPLLLTCAILATYAYLNLVFVTLASRFERRAVRAQDTWPQVTIAIVLALMELAAAGLMKALLLGRV